MKKFSLLLCVHNMQDAIQECLDSILEQSLKDFELLIFDNASDDETYSYLQLYQKQDKRIKIFHSDEEENITTIKNTLLKNAKGEIVTFLPIAEFDASFLQYIARKMNAEKYDAFILRTNMEYMSLPHCSDGVYSAKFDKKELFSYCPPILENIFYRNKFLTSIKAKFCDAEFGADFAFYIQTIATAKKVCCVNKNLLKTKINFSNFSKRELVNYRQISDAVEAGSKALKKCNLWESTEKFYIESLYHYLKIMIERIPYPVKNFFKNYIAHNITKQICFEDNDCKNYTSPEILVWLHQLKSKNYPSGKFEKSYYSKNSNVTSLVLSADSDKDATITGVLLQSIIANSDPHKFYDIYILSRGNITKRIVETIEKETYENCCVNFVDITNLIPQSDFLCMYKASSLYCIIPEILPLYKRVIHLKNNVVVLKDIALINKINTGKMPISGVRDYLDSSYIEDNLKLITETYIDDSVLIFDIPLCIKINMSQRFIDTISSNPELQKIPELFNTIFIDEIGVIEPIYNCKLDILNGKRLIKDYPYKLDQVAILNYESDLPYLNYYRDFSDIWWNFARQSFFYEVINNTIEKHTTSNREYQLMRTYIKETFLRIFTFGEKSKKHKENMTRLQSLIAEEQEI